MKTLPLIHTTDYELNFTDNGDGTFTVDNNQVFEVGGMHILSEGGVEETFTVTDDSNDYHLRYSAFGENFNGYGITIIGYYLVLASDSGYTNDDIGSTYRDARLATVNRTGSTITITEYTLNKGEIVTPSGIGQGIGVPLGSIIAIHPIVNGTKAIDASHWVLMDNTDTVNLYYDDGTYDIATKANLTDEVFLMGGNAYGVVTGSNFMTNHRHSTNSSDLALSSGAFSGASGSASTGASSVTGSVGGSDGTHNHCFGAYNVSSGAGGTVYRIGYYTTHNSSCGSGHGHGFSLTAGAQSGSATGISGALTSNTVSGTIGTTGMTNVSAGTIDNRPKYFQVKYYMRIK